MFQVLTCSKVIVQTVLYLITKNHTLLKSDESLAHLKTSHLFVLRNTCIGFTIGFELLFICIAEHCLIILASFG